MEALFVSGVLAFAALGGLATGAAAFARPAFFALQLGLVAEDASGLNETRAQYGGFFFLCGVLALTALAGWTPPVWTLVLTSVVFGGLILGRLSSLVLDAGQPRYRPAIRALYVIDSCGFLLSAGALATQLR